MKKIFLFWIGLGFDLVIDVLIGIWLVVGEKEKMYKSNDDKKDNFLKLCWMKICE